MSSSLRIPVFAAIALSLWTATTSAQQAPAPQAGGGHTPGSDADLAQQLSNPIANLVSVPLQFNWDQPVGVDRDTRYILNFQPVVPMPLNNDWNMIVRWIMPYVSQPPLFDGAVPADGFGDITTSFFFSPSHPGRFIWGVGPVFQLPVSSNAALGSGKWSAGPTFVVLKQHHGWTYGALANQLWSFAGDDYTGGADRDEVTATFLQPFLTYTNAQAVTFGINAEAQANWNADETWTVPIHLFASKLTKFGPFPMSLSGGVGIYVAAPNGSPDWRLRLAATLLLPRSK